MGLLDGFTPVYFAAKPQFFLTISIGKPAKIYLSNSCLDVLDHPDKIQIYTDESAKRLAIVATEDIGNSVSLSNSTKHKAIIKSHAVNSIICFAGNPDGSRRYRGEYYRDEKVLIFDFSIPITVRGPRAKCK